MTHTIAHTSKLLSLFRGGNRKLMRKKERDGLKAAKHEHQMSRAASKKRVLPDDHMGSQGHQPGPKKPRVGQQQPSHRSAQNSQQVSKEQHAQKNVLQGAAATLTAAYAQPRQLLQRSKAKGVEPNLNRDGASAQRDTHCHLCVAPNL